MTVAALETAVEQLRRDFQERIDALTAAIAELQETGAVSPGTAAAVTKANGSNGAGSAAAVPAPESAHAVFARAGVEAPPTEEVTPEVLLVIAAAVTAFLGKKVRIRSAKRLQTPYEIINPWSQQGRVFIQASHSLQRSRF
jgi:methylmalonyl-CoA carboxyltransferase large subunit